MDHKTTMLDIYEAMGGVANEDRTQVSVTPGQTKPFDIVLRVVPATFELNSDGVEKVTFAIFLDDEFRFGDTTPAGTPMYTIQHEEEIQLPVSQVRILKEVT